jgi:DNA-binding Lrp family transcriptional regulator
VLGVHGTPALGAVFNKAMPPNTKGKTAAGTGQEPPISAQPRSELPTEYDQWWVQKWADKPNRLPIRVALWERFNAVFPDDRVIDHAALLVPLDQEDAQILKCVRANLADSGRLNIADIARRIKLSRRKVKSRVTELLSLFLKKRYKPPSSRYEAIRLKGERSARYYLRHEFRFGGWTGAFKERIKKPTTRVTVGRGRYAHQSPMYLLLGALVMEFASDRKRPENWPPEQLAQDWSFNVDNCGKILAQKYGEPPWTARQITSAICKKRLKCSYCHADILPGFRLNGRRITKGRKSKNHFCDSVCKKRFSRSAA